MNNNYSIIIGRRHKLSVFLRQVFSVSCIVILPICIGIVVGSSAMQWMGFVMSAMMFVSFTAHGQSRKFSSTHEARVFLDKIDRGEA